MRTSDEIDQVAEALSKAQDGLNNAYRDRKNPHLRNNYATLESVLNAVRPALAAVGVSPLQGLAREGEDVIVTTRLLHRSGQWIETELSMPIQSGKGTTSAQQTGVSITYARRYALMALVCISSSDEDQDGNAAGPTPERPAPPRQAPKPFDLAEAVGAPMELLQAACAYKGWGDPASWDEPKARQFADKYDRDAVAAIAKEAADEMRGRFFARAKALGEGDAWEADRKAVLHAWYGVDSAGKLTLRHALGERGLRFLDPRNSDAFAKAWAAVTAGAERGAA